LNVHRVNDIRHKQVHTAEPLVPDISPFEAENAIATLNKYKSPGIDQMPAELIQAGGETLPSEINKLMNSIWNKQQLPDQWKESTVACLLKARTVKPAETVVVREQL
jgi:hypothetical protein